MAQLPTPGARTRALSAPDPTRPWMRHVAGQPLGTAELWLTAKGAQARAGKSPWLLPDPQPRVGAFRHALPGAGVVLFEPPRRPARREQDQFALVHPPAGRAETGDEGIAAGLDLE